MTITDLVDQVTSETQRQCVDDHRAIAGSQPIRLTPGGTSLNGHTAFATQTPTAVEPFQPTRSTRASAQSTVEPSAGWLELRLWAEMFYDAQQQRIATMNRAERGGVDPAVYRPYTDSLEKSEVIVRREMIKCYRRVAPAAIQAWVKASKGLGEPAMARLLGHLGHPRLAIPHHWEGAGEDRTLIPDEPFERGVGQLWQYCGHGQPGRRTRGMSVDEAMHLGSPQLKMIVHLISECAMKVSEGPYRSIYEQARVDYEDKSHSTECVRCGPSSKPAQVGSPWSKGHQHAAALRKVGKEILRDLWIVAGQS